MKHSAKIRQSIRLFNAAESFKERTAARHLLEEVLESAIYQLEVRGGAQKTILVMEHALADSRRNRGSANFTGNARSAARDMVKLGL